MEYTSKRTLLQMLVSCFFPRGNHLKHVSLAFASLFSERASLNGKDLLPLGADSFL